MIDYNDRGRLKWAGFYLSDHTEEIDSEKEQRAKQNLAKEQMTTEEISEVLNVAVIKNRPLCIQKEERNAEGYYPDDIVGKILGSDELGIYIGKNKIHYDEIRHIEFYQEHKWSHLE
ncbi:TPA: hypothetical protein QFP15_001442 [Enterococcus faecium]|uniref:hypothetical protein n=1 Tax=Enterococcus TaxID=1350 RepID=UPI000CF1BAA1|nr:hypothetical protein [Enterococcus faecium]EGP4930070.1 hypothetical protein [Enterococcus faecium]EGP5483130.1 hypothetical protein [Enterococcus faecium]EMF0445300.1 hypothetical protein [Enterococcus faecium]MBD9716622.1 hypothetical protein [Enterococcus faecium]MBD9738476.1 hypothetical protein [Enterococcus faecium]